jgi:hypothetical protein
MVLGCRPDKSYTPKPELEVPCLRLFHFTIKKRKEKFAKDEKTKKFRKKVGKKSNKSDKCVETERGYTHGYLRIYVE